MMCEHVPTIARLPLGMLVPSACLYSLPAWLLQYDDDWKRRDVLGVHAQKQEGLHWVGACVPVGRMMATDMDDLAHVADT